MNKTQFWTSLSGILTGVAAIVTAVGGIYLGYINRNKTSIQTVPSQFASVPSSQQLAQASVSPDPAASAPASGAISSSYKTWPSIADAKFSKSSSAWPVGNWSDGAARHFTSITDGKYFFNCEFRKPDSRWIESRYPSVVEFYTAVDVRLTESTIHEGFNFDILFGMASSRGYAFVISSAKLVGLTRFDGNNSTMIIEWARIPPTIDLTKPNRLAVLVENQTIKLFLNSSLVGEYRDPAFLGGKIGLQVEGLGVGRAIAEFDNFELRRKP